MKRTTMGTIVKLDRRQFLQAGLAAGSALTVGIVGFGARAAEQALLEPNAFLHIDADDRVTIVVKHCEFGQGTYTGLPTLVADELDADWSRIRVAAAPADHTRYNNLNWGSHQGTGGSSSINNAYVQMRRAGATARAMLVDAAAAAWQVDAGAIDVANGVITHAASGRSAGFGAFVEAAARLPVPADVPLKSAAEFVYIGRDVPRTDIPAKIDGSAVYTQDIYLPDMLTAVVAHPPRFGAVLKSFDAAAAQKIRGVEQIAALDSGVAVIARDFWSANKGRDALVLDWDESNAFKLGSAELLTQYRQLATTPGQVATLSGDPAAAFAQAAQVVEAEYEFPFLAHATMEPMNCVAQVTPAGCELWYGAQSLTSDQRAVARALDIKAERVSIHTLYAGGSFGRRGNSHADYVVEAARVAQAMGNRKPVKLVWTREDDMRAGYFRPLYYHKIKGALDAAGNITAWQQRIVGQSIMAAGGYSVGDQVDRTSVEGASNLPYAIPNLMVDLHSPAPRVPVLWWRSVGSSHTAFSTEVFLDELAHAAGRDPVALRLDLLRADPRRARVVKLAAEQAGWSRPLPAGRGRGIAVHKAFKSYVAEVAEVTVRGADDFSVDRVTIAVDCGVVINPDIVRAQMEGGMGYGLCAALHGAITLTDGYVQESNFDDYRVLRNSQMPEVAVHIVPSAEHPSGVGEPGTPPIAPAVANALFAATGKRYRRLPLS